MKCSKCEGEMERGFTTDSGGSSGTFPLYWYSGVFKRTFWGNVQTKGRKLFYVQTWRCTRCAYLESYAPDPDAKRS